jgi:transcription antitermination factor NusG
MCGTFVDLASRVSGDTHAETLPYFALYVRSRQERVVEKRLHSKGYTAFSPLYRSRRNRSDRTVELELPLFPGYVFCQFDPSFRLPILKTPGVVTIVGVGNIPQPIDDVEISSIQKITIAGSGLAKPWPFFREGQRVRIEAGPLCGVEGKLIRVKNRARLVVSVTLLKRSIAVEIDEESMHPLP